MGTNARPADERLLLFWDSSRGGMKLWADDAVLAKRREIDKRGRWPSIRWRHGSAWLLRSAGPGLPGKAAVYLQPHLTVFAHGVLSQ
jgi:hypothetical protein